jgi:hypothetical protein
MSTACAISRPIVDFKSPLRIKRIGEVKIRNSRGDVVRVRRAHVGPIHPDMGVPMLKLQLARRYKALFSGVCGAMSWADFDRMAFPRPSRRGCNYVPPGYSRKERRKRKEFGPMVRVPVRRVESLGSKLRRIAKVVTTGKDPGRPRKGVIPAPHQANPGLIRRIAGLFNPKSLKGS